MIKQSRISRLLLLVAVLASLMLVQVVAAQDATTVPAGETTVDDTNEAGNEGVAAEEAEAQEVAGEEQGVEGAAAEAEESTNPLVPLGINSGFLIAQIINFSLIALLLGGLGWRPLVNMLDSRSAKIQKGLEDAAAAANARRNAEAEAEKIQSQARAEAARAVEEARGRGEEVARSVESEARSEAERIRAEARARANDERDRQLADLRGQVAAISVAVAERLIGESLDATRQQAIISDFFTRLPSGVRELSGDVEIISAMPLTAEEQTRVAGELGSATVTYSVDPEILGGLVVRSQDRVIDGSVRSGLTEIAGRMR